MNLSIAPRALGLLGLAATLTFCGGSNQQTKDDDEQVSTMNTSDKDAEPSASASEPAVTVTRFVMVIPDTLRARCSLTTNKAYFDYDSAEVGNATASFLDNVADCLTDGPLQGEEVVLIGHTDPRGDAENNKELGMKRATAVQSYLQEHGVSSSRVETISKGEKKAFGDEPIEWMFDRRVDIRIDDAEEASR